MVCELSNRHNLNHCIRAAFLGRLIVIGAPCVIATREQPDQSSERVVIGLFDPCCIRLSATAAILLRPLLIVVRWRRRPTWQHECQTWGDLAGGLASGSDPRRDRLYRRRVEASGGLTISAVCCRSGGYAPAALGCLSNR